MMNEVSQLGRNKFYIQHSGTMEKVTPWLEANIGIEGEDWLCISSPNRTDRTPSMLVWFIDETDSMAFKLRWT